jgi:hypothetical protein
MRPQLIMYLAFCLLTGNLLCLMMDGAWIGAEDVNLMGYLTGMSNLQTASWTVIFTVPIGFFTHGLPRMLLWDFSFFYGSWELIRWLMMAISIGVLWGVAQTFFSSIQQGIFGRR